MRKTRSTRLGRDGKKPAKVTKLELHEQGYTRIQQEGVLTQSPNRRKHNRRKCCNHRDFPMTKIITAEIEAVKGERGIFWPRTRYKKKVARGESRPTQQERV